MPYMESPLRSDYWEQSSKSELLREHVTKLDSSFHPVLSLPSGKLPNENLSIFFIMKYNLLKSLIFKI